jgi:hypothetical protein
VSAAGLPEGEVIDLCGTGSTVCTGVSMTSDGMGHFALVWADNRSGDWRVYFNRVDANSCERSGADTQVSAIWGSRQVVAFSSMLYAVAWVDQADGLWVTRLDQFGSKIADTQVAAGHSGALKPTIAGMGATAEWGLAWNDNPDGLTYEQLHFQRMNESGALLGAPARITNVAGPQRYLHIASGDASYGLLWLDQSTNSARFRRLDRYGQPTSPAIAIAAGTMGAIESDGSKFLAAYHTGRSRLVICQ